jgi:hypothetical protein
MNTRNKIIIPAITILLIGLFFIYISVNGFSMYHAGIYVELLSEKQLERFGAEYEIQTVTKEELLQFPQIYAMIDLLLEEKENRQGTRSFFVDFNTYRIFDSHGELKIKNHMSDSGATNLYQDYRLSFESSVFKYGGNYFFISSWIA